STYEVSLKRAPNVTAKESRQLLDDNNLACIATHRSWDALRGRTDDEIAFHHELRCDYVAIGGIPKQYGVEVADGYRRFVDDALPVIARLKAGGIRFGFHNHAHEFQRANPAQASTLFDILIERGGPDFHLEVDVYWAWHAGVDPGELLRRCAGRVPVIHIKDKNVTEDGPGIAAIGEGNLPWARILADCQAAGVDWLAVEQDTCPRDPFDCLRASWDYLNPLLP
ncbi:MAG: sugar phosphate isomerase/epimerase family protein, partial [Armatimonadaceae bacterium]